MEATEDNLKTLGYYLGQVASVVDAERKKAEQYLDSIKATPGYATLLLKFVSQPAYPEAYRLQAAIQFKNLVRYHWRTEEGEQQIIADAERDQIKQFILTLMLSAPRLPQKQLADALWSISQYDFPKRWPNLVEELVAKAQSNDFTVVNRVLGMAHTIFQRYRSLYGTLEVEDEVVFILDRFAAPLLQLFGRASKAAEDMASNTQALAIIVETLNLVAQCFYDLSYIDLPAFFEKNLTAFMTGFLKWLSMANVKEPALVGPAADPDEGGPLHELQASILHILNLYTEKYEREFQPFLQKFVEAAWNLLMAANDAPKHDSVVSSAIAFLTQVACSVNHGLFAGEAIMKNIVERVLVPCMTLRAADVEAFEDDPDEYIKADIEGSDVDTRRRAAVELVKGLRRNYEAQITQIFASYINNMLARYAEAPAANWLQKDVALYLITALAVRAQSGAQGATKVNELVPIPSFFQSNVAPDLQAGAPHPVLQADALKFVVTFRSQLPVEAYPGLLSAATTLLGSPSRVVHTYAANTVEKLLMVKDRAPGSGAYAARVTPDMLAPAVAPVLTALFGVLERTSMQANHYVMRALMRVIVKARTALQPVFTTVWSKLVAMLQAVCANPQNPTFYHYLFEAIAALIKNVGPTGGPQVLVTFEQGLFPNVQTILEKDIVEFTPYAFQLLSQLLQLHNSVPDTYWGIFDMLLAPVCWQRQGNVPGLVLLLQAYLRKAGTTLASQPRFQELLGVWTKLNDSVRHDHFGFHLLNTVIEHISLQQLKPFMDNILKIIFVRLSKRKTKKYVRSFVIFLSVFAGKHGAPTVVNIIDGVQPGVWGNVLKAWIEHAPQISGTTERRLCAIGATKLLCECPQMVAAPYAEQWGPMLQSVVSMFEDLDTTGSDDDDVEIVDTPGYTNVFCKLSNASSSQPEPFPDIPTNVRAYLATSLHKLSQHMPGKLMPLVQQHLSAEQQVAFGKYFQQAGVNQPYLA